MDKIGSGYNTPLSVVSRNPAVSETSTDSIAALRQLLTRAARTVNETKFTGEGREVTFSLDSETRRPVVKIIDTESKEVVAQWPPEYLLRMAEELKSTKRNSG